MDALHGLSGVLIDNTPQVRRNLRNDLERRGLAINDEFIASFSVVNSVRFHFSFTVARAAEDGR